MSGAVIDFVYTRFWATFNVADDTGNSNPDLTISGTLINQTGTQGNAAGALTKTGLGTLELIGAKTYTGATNVNPYVILGGTTAGSAGTLNITGANSVVSITAASVLAGGGAGEG